MKEQRSISYEKVGIQILENQGTSYKFNQTFI